MLVMLKKKGRRRHMLDYEELAKAVKEREVHWFVYKKMAEEMRGKADEEKNEISRKYAKIILNTCPKRREGRLGRRRKRRGRRLKKGSSR